jgi:hypothetical protein
LIYETLSQAPFAHSNMAQYLTDQIAAISSIKSEQEIARDAGYDKANMLSMFADGAVRVPLDRVLTLAKALQVNPAGLFHLALGQFWPGFDDVADQIFGNISSESEDTLPLSKWKAALDAKGALPLEGSRQSAGEAMREIELKIHDLEEELAVWRGRQADMTDMLH